MQRVLNIILLLVIGLFAYWVFQPEIFFLKILNLNNHNSQIKENFGILFFKNHFADIVWCLAIFQAVTILNERKLPILYSYLLLSLPFLSEIFQGFGFIAGTFDWLDVLIYFILNLLFYHKKNLICKI